MPVNKDISVFLEKKFGIVGTTGPMEDSIDLLMQSAPTDLNVLITGQTGTGKEVFANAIHGLSKRKNYKFVSVNCGAIPETLLESELFGHIKGAYTSADTNRKGFFETANLGTIFLDEIGEMPFGTQVKLLRVLESGEFSRLGSSDLIKVDVRVIAATNRDLEEEVKKGNFREDLYFRLKNVHLKLPALNEHTEDIPVLFDYFRKKIAESINLPVYPVNQDTVNILKAQYWKGNIREFKNLIQTIITLEKTSDISPDILRKYLTPALPPYKPITSSNIVLKEKPKIEDRNELNLIFRSLLELQNDITELKHLNASMANEISDLHNLIDQKEYDYSIVEDDNTSTILDEHSIEEIEKIMIINALKKFEGNRRKASKQLGISERTLYRKISEFNLKNDL